MMDKIIIDGVTIEPVSEGRINGRWVAYKDGISDQNDTPMLAFIGYEVAVQKQIIEDAESVISGLDDHYLTLICDLSCMRPSGQVAA